MVLFLSPRHLFSNELEKLPPNRDPNDLSFGNSVFRVKFDDRERKPIFGHRYSFFLRDAVEDVPEYIVHWDNFEQYAVIISLFFLSAK